MQDFSSAIEQRDAQALLHLYADCAELSLAECSSLGQPPRLVQGKAAIAGWLTQWCEQSTSVRVVHEAEVEAELTMIAEYRQEDGTREVIALTAHLVGGLVSRQFVVLV